MFSGAPGYINEPPRQITAPATLNVTLNKAATISTGTDTWVSGIAGYLLSETPDTPSIGDPRWRPDPPTSYAFSSPGQKTLYLFVKDRAGNIAMASAQCDVTVAEMPQVTGFTVEATALEEPMAKVLTLTGTPPTGASIDGYMVTVDDPTPPDAAHPDWVSDPAGLLIGWDDYVDATLYPWVRSSDGLVSQGTDKAITVTVNSAANVINNPCFTEDFNYDASPLTTWGQFNWTINDDVGTRTISPRSNSRRELFYSFNKTSVGVVGCHAGYCTANGVIGIVTMLYQRHQRADIDSLPNGGTLRFNFEPKKLDPGCRFFVMLRGLDSSGNMIFDGMNEAHRIAILGGTKAGNITTYHLASFSFDTVYTVQIDDLVGILTGIMGGYPSTLVNLDIGLAVEANGDAADGGEVFIDNVSLR